MIPELGHFALVLAFFVCLTSAGVAGFANLRRGVALVAFARNATLLLFALVLFAFLCLMQSFAAGDFSVLNVATNSNSLLPLQYRISATWGSHEGSMLLWVLMLTGWSAAVAQFSKQLPDVMVARVLVVLAAITAVFLAFTLLTSNPFERLIPAAPEGRDLNPLLQDPGMIFHPPLLYTGYVGFSVAFSFAIAGLMQHTTKQQIDAFPGVKDLPVLGALFRSRDFQNAETELVVIVTPYLVDPTDPQGFRDPDRGYVTATDARTMLFGNETAGPSNEAGSNPESAAQPAREHARATPNHLSSGE